MKLEFVLKVDPPTTKAMLLSAQPSPVFHGVAESPCILSNGASNSMCLVTILAESSGISGSFVGPVDEPVGVTSASPIAQECMISVPMTVGGSEASSFGAPLKIILDIHIKGME